MRVGPSERMCFHSLGIVTDPWLRSPLREKSRFRWPAQASKCISKPYLASIEPPRQAPSFVNRPHPRADRRPSKHSDARATGGGPRPLSCRPTVSGRAGPEADWLQECRIGPRCWIQSRLRPEARGCRASASRARAADDSAVRVLCVDAESDGQRIDNFLLRHLKGVPRSHLYRVMRRGEVRVNKGRVKASHRLRTGDLVRIPPVRTARRRRRSGSLRRVSPRSRRPCSTRTNAF
jgi:hypothetical protein